jgi:hypothetical protein
VRAGRPVRIFGAAWSGDARIAQVLVQAGGNMPFEPATLLAPDERYAWRLFERQWTPPAPGRYALRSRAIDATGNVQPDTPQPDRESYLANWSIPVEVRVVPDQAGGEEYVI